MQKAGVRFPGSGFSVLLKKDMSPEPLSCASQGIYIPGRDFSELLKKVMYPKGISSELSKEDMPPGGFLRSFPRRQLAPEMVFRLPGGQYEQAR